MGGTQPAAHVSIARHLRDQRLTTFPLLSILPSEWREGVAAVDQLHKQPFEYPIRPAAQQEVPQNSPSFWAFRQGVCKDGSITTFVQEYAASYGVYLLEEASYYILDCCMSIPFAFKLHMRDSRPVPQIQPRVEPIVPLPYRSVCGVGPNVRYMV